MFRRDLNRFRKLKIEHITEKDDTAEQIGFAEVVAIEGGHTSPLGASPAEDEAEEAQPAST